MHGLTIDFEIKRPRKINQIMNYFLVLALAVFAFTGLVYVQYLAKQVELNNALAAASSAENSYNKTLAEAEKYQKPSNDVITYDTDTKKLLAGEYDYSVLLKDVDNILSLAEFDGYVNLSGALFSVDKKYVTVTFTFNDTLAATEIVKKKQNLSLKLRDVWKGNRVNVTSEGFDSSTELEMTYYYGNR